MNTSTEQRISNLVELAGGKFVEIRKGEGIIISDPVTNTQLSIPLDSFFTNRDSDALEAVRSHILCCRAYFNAPKLAKQRIYTNIYEELCRVQNQVEDLIPFIKEPRGLERVSAINVRFELLKYYLEIE